MESFRRYVLDEMRVIRLAPVIFITAVLVLGGAIWLAINWAYSTVLTSKIAQIELLDRQVADWKQKTERTTPDDAKALIEALTVRVKRLEPRTISAGQRSQIAKFVNVPAGLEYYFSIMSDMTCLDCNQYAVDFQGILFDAHWILQPVKIAAMRGASPKGVAIVTPNPAAPLPEATALQQGLIAAGIAFDLNPGWDLKPDGSGKKIAGIIISARATAYGSQTTP